MQTPMGQYLAQKEADFFRRHLQYLNRQVAVQLGGIWQRPSENMIVVPRDVRMNAEMLAFETHSVDVLLMPHLLEVSSADLVLQEAFRILKPEGVIEFKTDNVGLFEYSLEVVKESKWKLDFCSFDFHSEEKSEGNIMTEYEEKFSSQGNKICKMIISR